MYTREELLEIGMDELEEFYEETVEDYDSLENLMEFNVLI